MKKRCHSLTGLTRDFRIQASQPIYSVFWWICQHQTDQESNPGIQACLSCFGGCPFWILSHHLLHFDIAWGWDAIHLSTSPLGKQRRTLIWEKKDQDMDVTDISFFRFNQLLYSFWYIDLIWFVTLCLDKYIFC